MRTALLAVHPDDKRRLSTSPFFKALPAGLRDRLTRGAVVRTYSKGAVLWRRGERARYIFVVLSGRIGVFDTEFADRTSAIIDLFHPGDAPIGTAALTRAPYLFSAIAIDETCVIAIPVSTFRKYVRIDHSLALAVALNVIAGWRRLLVQVHQLKQFSANQRLGYYLLAQTNQTSGAASIRLNDDQTLIAAILGVTPESLSRSFAQLRAQGVSKRGRMVTLTDIERLRAYAGATSKT